jgi:hypothetical protein
MATIYKQFYNPSTQFIAYSDKDAEFQHWFNIQASELEYKFINITDAQTLIHVKLQLSELLDAHRVYSQSLIGIKESSLKTDGSLVNLTKDDLVSVLQNTLPTRSTTINNFDDNININSAKCPFRIHVTSINSDFTDFKYSVASPEAGAEFTHTISVETNNTASYISTPTPWKSLFDTITMTTEQTTVATGDVINVKVECSNENVDYVYLEQVSGILDRTRVKLTDGIGYFNILTSTLLAGDEAIVKAGYKLYVGLTEFTKQIQ